jgi:hypothetical protein
MIIKNLLKNVSNWGITNFAETPIINPNPKENNMTNIADDIILHFLRFLKDIVAYP